MTIRFKQDNTIEFDRGDGARFTLTESSDGFVFNGTITATQIGSFFQGAVTGYTTGGTPNAAGITIDKFPFATSANATDVGDLTVTRVGPAGQSSATAGYTSGGSSGNVIDRFSFATNANATDIGDLTVNRNYTTGQSSSTTGYTSGGESSLNNIDRFPFATSANATDVGDLTEARSGVSGQSSAVSGYTTGGAPGPGVTNIIDRFPFSTNANATDVGDLTLARVYGTGQSSTVSGYTSGGGFNIPSFTNYNTIDKFSFVSNGGATDVGDLSDTAPVTGRQGGGGQSSTVSGYTSGGLIGFATPGNRIDKFPFAADANATDVSDLSIDRGYNAGQQD